MKTTKIATFGFVVAFFSNAAFGDVGKESLQYNFNLALFDLSFFPEQDRPFIKYIYLVPWYNEPHNSRNAAYVVHTANSAFTPFNRFNFVIPTRVSEHLLRFDLRFFAKGKQLDQLRLTVEDLFIQDYRIYEIDQNDFNKSKGKLSSVQRLKPEPIQRQVVERVPLFQPQLGKIVNKCPNCGVYCAFEKNDPNAIIRCHGCKVQFIANHHIDYSRQTEIYDPYRARSFHASKPITRTETVHFASYTNQECSFNCTKPLKPYFDKHKSKFRNLADFVPFIISSDLFITFGNQTLDGGLYYELMQIDRLNRDQILKLAGAEPDQKKYPFRFLVKNSRVTGDRRVVIYDGVALRTLDIAYDSRNQNQDFLYEKDADYDAEEIFIELPTGLQAYLITDADGNRANSVPENIACDNRKPNPGTLPRGGGTGNKILLPAISCYGCHADRSNFLPIKALNSKNGAEFLFEPARKRLDFVTKKFYNLSSGELWRGLYYVANDFQYDHVDLKRAYAEYGLPPNLRLINPAIPGLTLLQSGYNVDRNTFIREYQTVLDLQQFQILNFNLQGFKHEK